MHALYTSRTPLLYSQVNAFAKGRPHLHELAALMDWDPLPITISCFNRLNESYQQGLAWQQRAEALLGGTGPPTSLTSLEKLTNESTRLGCVLPKAKDARARLAAVRALVADIDAVLPVPVTVRGSAWFFLNWMIAKGSGVAFWGGAFLREHVGPFWLLIIGCVVVVKHTHTFCTQEKDNADAADASSTGVPSAAAPINASDTAADSPSETRRTRTQTARPPPESSNPPSSSPTSMQPAETASKTPPPLQSRAFGPHLWTAQPQQQQKGPTVEQLRALQQRATALHATCDELVRVQDALDAAAAWESDVQQARADGGPLPRNTVASLLEAASGLSVYLPAAEGLAVALEQALQWDALAAKALANDAISVARLTELQAAASALPVAVEALRELNAALEGRQWREAVGKALVGPLSVARMIALVQEAEAHGAGDSPAAQQLRYVVACVAC